MNYPILFNAEFHFWCRVIEVRVYVGHNDKPICFSALQKIKTIEPLKMIKNGCLFKHEAKIILGIKWQNPSN